MPSQSCLGPICFYALNANGPKIFGFGEYLAGLALIVLAWTIADTRYQFRVEIAPLPLQRLAFVSVALIGLLALLTDLWRAQQWLVPVGGPLPPAIWQALLGLAFLLTFLGWAWFAFIRPSTFGPRNAKRFIRSVYRAILRGSATELAIVADEVSRSASQLIKYAPDDQIRRRGIRPSTNSQLTPAPDTALPGDLSEVEGLANDFLQLIADRRFCRAVVSGAPVLALALLQEVAEKKKYTVAIGTFTRNIVSEALANKDSFLFHETEGYETGLLGHHRPLSHAIFGDYNLLVGVNAALDADFGTGAVWDAHTWEAFCRAALIALRAYSDAGLPAQSPILFRLKSRLESAAYDVCELNGVSSIDWRSGPYAKLRVIVQFLKKALEILDGRPVSRYITLRTREKHGPDYSIYDVFAELIVDILWCASAVRSPRDTCWTVQHNAVWSWLFDSFAPKGQGSKYVRHKVRRMLYDEVVDLERFPNFRSARLLAICLNTMGLRQHPGINDSDSRALHRSLLSWTRKNYSALRAANEEVAEACLVEGIAYEEVESRIVKTYPAYGLRKMPKFVYLDVDRIQPAPAATSAE